MQKTNTHFYDTKLDNTKKLIEKELLVASQVDRRNKLMIFRDLCKRYNNRLICLNKIVNDYNSGNSGNIDNINKLNADDLLYLSAKRILIEKDKDFEELFLYQMEEMKTGMCPQGRTIRLLQILVV